MSLVEAIVNVCLGVALGMSAYMEGRGVVPKGLAEPTKSNRNTQTQLIRMQQKRIRQLEGELKTEATNRAEPQKEAHQ